jgi:hypothetical protein
MTGRHGAERIADLRVDSYNLALREGDGFLGDRVRSRAFALILDRLREERRRAGSDPLGEVDSADRAALDRLLDGGGEGSALLREAIHLFAGALADVVRRFLEVGAWRETQRIVVGGGLRESRVGEEAIRQADTLLTCAGLDVTLQPIRSHPDEAALLGAVHLCPPDLLDGRDAILAVDIGGTNLRAGVVLLNRGLAPDGSAAEVLMREQWCHDDAEAGRDETVERLNRMLAKLADDAGRAGARLAPFVGLACPGEIAADGAILRGGQNLPGDWEAPDFNLPERVRAALPRLADAPTRVVLHNDAVVQGLSERAALRGVARWGVLTIGTGLGNAHFTALTDS